MTTQIGERKSKQALFSDIAEAITSYMADPSTEGQGFVLGKTPIPLSAPTYGAPEVIEALDSLLSTWVTMGLKVKNFEQMFSDYIGPIHTVMVNSGSSANLLALTALELPSGAEVITPALTWATTVWPIAQVGAIPVLVDVDRETYNISPGAIEAAITPKTRAIMPVHVLGHACDMDAIMELAVQHKLFVIEDCCEALGARYKGRNVGNFGDLSTFSFYFSHHISTIEGGMIVTNNSKWADLCRSQRSHGWVRDLQGRADLITKHSSIDPSFLFIHQGYNLRPTEIQGAFGIHQLPKLEGLIEVRRANAAYLNEALAPYEKWLMLPSEAPGVRHSYMGYPITVKERAPFTKTQLSRYLEGKGLATRPLLTGNITRQPAMQGLQYRVSGSLENTQYIHDNGFYFGPHQGIGEVERKAIVFYFNEFMRRYT